MGEIIVPISVGLRGDVKLIMRNVVTDEVETREMRNTIFKNYLNALFNSYYVLNNGIFRSINGTVLIGTSDQPASRNDTGIVGTTLATKVASSSIVATVPPTKTFTAVFPAGTGVGLVKEVVMANTARQVVSPGLDKTAQHELTVVWTFTLSRGADSWSGTITGGQRDGVTDVNWIATINDNQLGGMVGSGAGNYSLNPYLYVGSSNAESNLASDLGTTLKGATLFGGAPAFKEALSYVADSFYRDYRVGLETSQGNGSIGEAIVTLSVSAFPIGRITFTPALDKVDTYRLYLTFRIAVVNAS